MIVFNDLNRAARTSIVLVFAFAAFPTSLLAQESRFATIQLPLGVSIEVPKNWRLLDGDANETIVTAGEAALNLSGMSLPTGQRVNLFRANSMPRSTYAGIAINAAESEILPQDVMLASDSEIQELATDLEEGMNRVLQVNGQEVLEFYGVRKDIIDGHPALTIEYKRSGDQGAVIVQVTRLFLGSREVSLNLSYRESEETVWKPIVTYIRRSLRVGNGG